VVAWCIIFFFWGAFSDACQEFCLEVFKVVLWVSLSVAQVQCQQGWGILLEVKLNDLAENFMNEHYSQ
jgi:hypothetical protein